MAIGLEHHLQGKCYVRQTQPVCPIERIYARRLGGARLQQRADRSMSRHIRRDALRARPMNRVSDHPLDQRMMINGIRFVARAEIKNPSAAAHPTVSAAEDLAAFEPRNEDLLIGRRDTEWFAVT